MLSSTAYNTYKEAINATLDPTSNFLFVTHEQFMNLPSLSFTISGVCIQLLVVHQQWGIILISSPSFPLFNQVSFTLNADAQAIPSKFAPTTPAGVVFLAIGSLADANLTITEDYIFGTPALERFYAVLDTSNQRVELAYTSFTNGTFNTAT